MAAGEAGDTVLAARFDSEGVIDQSFGNGGFAAPPVVGPAASFTEGKPRSWAEDVAVTGDGGAVLGGGTEQWSTWVPYQRDIAPHCTACPQPLLVRLDSTGKPDPAFGSGGILHLVRPDGSVLEGAISEVNALADGRVLVNGSLASREPFVARLNQDGSYDPTFGDRGLALPKFPCTSEDRATLRRAGCTPAAVVTLRARGLRGGHPSLSLTVKPSLDWAAVARAQPDPPARAPAFAQTGPEGTCRRGRRLRPSGETEVLPTPGQEACEVERHRLRLRRREGSAAQAARRNPPPTAPRPAAPRRPAVPDRSSNSPRLSGATLSPPSVSSAARAAEP